jgi:small nuclear ribonucleoprotein
MQNRPPMQQQHNPIDQLAGSLGKNILVRVKKTRLYSGKLMSFDQHLNLLLDDCVQIYETENDKNELVEEREDLGEILLRGDNVIFIEFGQ